ncbi:MAG: Crp/Fnr family transcriptional regulator [Acidobacteriota bacterium]|nr:Crp/Fnr family transcriptional regulator [Acidobacteriota bacterium]
MPVPDDELLRRLPLFRRVSAPLRARVAEVARLKSYGKGELIFAEDDPSDAFIVIVSGRVKVFKSTPTGKEIILEIFGDGDPLGAVALYEGAPFMASALSLEPTAVISIEQAAFFRLLEAEPVLVRGLLSGLTLRLAELTRRLAELTGARVETRFARLFLKLSDQIGRPERGGVFVPMSLSRQELADLAGTTIETAIRIMSRWQKDNVLHTEKDGFVVVDRPALDELAAS